MDNLIIFCAKYLIFFLPLIVIGILFQMKLKNSKQFLVAIIVAGISGLILSMLAGLFYFHHRPFIVQNIQPLVMHSGDNGFPSDHTLLATALATVIYFYRRRLGVAALILALVVGIARVMAHVHWPIDILGGLVLGAIAGWAGYLLAMKLFPSGQQTTVDQKHQ